MGSRRTLFHSKSQYFSDREKSLFQSLAFIFLLAIAFAGIGCKKKPTARLTATVIHGITREMVAAAKTASPPGTEIRAAMQASDENLNTSDRLDITIISSSANDAARAAIANVQQALSTVATRHGLTEEPSESREGILFYFKRANVVTHAVHIHIGTKGAVDTGNASRRSNGARRECSLQRTTSAALPGV